jgi:hypothetical protein
MVAGVCFSASSRRRFSTAVTTSAGRTVEDLCWAPAKTNCQPQVSRTKLMLDKYFTGSISLSAVAARPSGTEPAPCSIFRRLRQRQAACFRKRTQSFVALPEMLWVKKSGLTQKPKLCHRGTESQSKRERFQGYWVFPLWLCASVALILRKSGKYFHDLGQKNKNSTRLADRACRLSSGSFSLCPLRGKCAAPHNTSVGTGFVKQ